MGTKNSKIRQGKNDSAENFIPLSITAHGDDDYGNVTHCYTKKYVDIWAENFQCFALDTDGYLYSWGLNEHCQLGNGKFENYFFPQYEEKYNFVNTFSIINQSKGIINEKIFRDINPLYYRKIKKISCGNGFTVCLDRDGLVYTWGRGNKGELGYDLIWEESTVISGIKCQSTPRLVENLANRKLVITDVICGSDFTFAYDDSSTPYSWGNNNHHQLARVSQHVADCTPDKADFLIEFEKTLKICCGWMHGVVLTEMGEVYIWGNPFYDYNNNSPDIPEPVIVELPYRAVDISSGFHHFCAILSDDGVNNFELYTWGANEYGQCGHKKEEKIIYLPKRVDIHNNSVVDVACGAFHTIVQASSGRFYGFGHNFSKEIGDYSAESIDRPVLLDFKAGEEMCVKKILCGNGFTIFAQIPSANYTAEEHKYSNLINKAEEKVPVGGNLEPRTHENIVIHQQQ